ncbi:MAG: ABC transporter permease, partial [Gammaproteobacteria bacterium]
MARSARDLISADIAVRLNKIPDQREQQVLHRLVELGAELTQVTETLSMASTPSSARPLLVTVKAVDPDFYPFYGSVGLDPALPFRQALTDDAALVSREFLIRTGAATGGSIQIGSGQFRIAAILNSEPDRLASGVEIGPRMMITQKGLERAGLIQFGSRAARSFLFRLPAQGLPLETARGILRAGLQRVGRISDYREPNPSLSDALDRMTNFLSLIGLLSLLVGGLGVATTIHTYLQQKLDSIAIVKCLGGRSSQIMRIYLMQGLSIGLVGSLLGVGLGYVVQILFPRLLRGLIDLPTELELAPGAALQGLAIGMVTTLLFLLPPLLAVRKVRPARLFLREMPETHYSTLQRLRHDPLPLISGLILLAGVGALASWLGNSWALGLRFMGGLAGAILVLSLGARLLLVGLRHLPRPSSLSLRHGLKNLHRPGSHVASVLVALGIGVAFTMTVYLVQTSLLT